ncbi:MAG TPA: autotransporter-associated beta strand repeat-containing protein, partial [Thermoguttaceae bacterium]|nr:autotransporter-associated beta strand repeat-containing protein [Thermoguttaceae bacterium]
ATKSGTNTLGIIDTTITGPGGITINEGTVILARSSWTNGALTANSGTTVWFSYNTGSYSYQMNMVVNGATIRSDGAANSVESPIALTGSNTIQVDNNSLTLTGVISGTGSITKTAGGTLILSGANTYTGQTTVSQGVLRITHGSALGAGDGTAATGTTVSSGARLELTDGITVANEALQLAGDGGGQGALRNASGTNTWAGPISLTAGSRIDIVGGSTLTISGNVSLGSNSLVVRGGGNATISGQLSGSGNLTLTDGGVLTLGNANNINTFSGKIMASYGVISVADVAALGSHSQLRLGQGTYSVDTGTLRYTGTTNATIDKEIRLFSDATYGKARLEVTNTAATLTFTGNFQYESGATTGGQWILAGAGSGVIYGNITTTDASLSKVDSGTWTLAGNNSYKGTTTVSAGVLRISSPTALGTTDGGTTVSSGARLELAGGITVTGEALSIAGDGGNFFGALQSTSGTNTWAGPITLAANDTRIGANGAGQVLRVTGAIGDGGSGYNLAVRNEVGGETILSGQNTYGGDTRVVVGVLKIDGGNDRLPTGSPLQI